MRPTAVIAALNEEATVGQVVRTVRLAGLDALVVDDGSTDRTAEQAAAMGARVLRCDQNQGKGQAMLAGARACEADPVGFFDADLVRLRVDHVERMCAAAELGYDMVCGLRDYGPSGNAAQLVLPIITGERIVRRWVLDAVPEDCWNGYDIETAMNYAVTANGGKTALLFLDGLTIRTKFDKAGWLEGTLGQIRMFSRIAEVSDCLDEYGACST